MNIREVKLAAVYIAGLEGVKYMQAQISIIFNQRKWKHFWLSIPRAASPKLVSTGAIAISFREG